MNQQPQPNQLQTPLEQPQKSNNKQIWIIIGLVGCLPMLAIIGILVVMIVLGTSGAKDKAKDAQIKSNISQEYMAAQVYFDEHQTYEGLTVNPTVSGQASKAGSSIIIQSITESTVIIYAKLPSSGKLFCADALQNGKEVDNISPSQTSCQ